MPIPQHPFISNGQNQKTHSIFHSEAFNFQPYSRVQILTLKKPFVTYYILAFFLHPWNGILNWMEISQNIMEQNFAMQG